MAKGIRIKSLNELGKGAWKLTQDSQRYLSESGSRAKVRGLPSGPTPQEMLWREIHRRWPEDAKYEFANAVPQRRFRIDIAFPSARLAIELDGWQFHAKFKGDFTRHTARQNLLVKHGWRVLRFTAGQVRTEMSSCIEMIASTLEQGSDL
jgi:very-short-patch-repair endonuclease